MCATITKRSFYTTTIRFYSRSVNNYLNKDPELLDIKKYIPPKYLNISTQIANEHLYLVCPRAAKTIANHVVSSIQANQLIAETNAGLGLITTELLDQGIKQVRMYESCPDFRNELRNFGTAYPGRVELFTKDIYHIPRFAFMDKHDGNNRVACLLKNVPKKSWNDDPTMTVIGTMTDLGFLKYLIKSLSLQAGPLLLGRFQFYAVLKEKDYAILSATIANNLYVYQPITILFQLLLNIEKLETFSRDIFLPWERSKKSNNLEKGNMAFVRINFKKDLPVTMEELLRFYYFLKQVYGRGNNLVIPTAEKWVPGCGLNILLPTLKHKDYFKDIDIFTKFRELTPNQTLSVFKEVIATSSFSGSPFTAMIENELMKSETVETNLAKAIFEKRLEKDLEILNYQDDID